MKKNILAVILSTIWISISEFVRNQFLLIDSWTAHYSSLGMVFPVEPVNGMVWGIWASLFAVFIHILAGKFNFMQTALLAWVSGFVFMWLVIGNLGVLPFGILYIAVPLSMLEVAVAVWISKKFQVKN